MIPSNHHTSRPNAGFTLFEVLVALTVSALLSVVLIQFLSGQTERSWRPIQNLNQTLELQSVMGQITSDYRNLLLTNTTPLKTLQNNIRNDDYGIDDPNIEAESYCFSFTGGSGIWNEGSKSIDCKHTPDPGNNDDDTLMRVILSTGDQTLTSLFSR